MRFGRAFPTVAGWLGRLDPGVDGPASDALLKAGRFFTRWDETDDGRAVFREGGRAGDVFYRDRWSHDKVVRSTHGVNCTGSCSWKVYVKDGIITWETPADRLPLRRPGPARSTSPAAAPAAPRSPGTPTPPPACATPTPAACSSRCTARRSGRLGDPVLAWAEIVGDPERAPPLPAGPRQGRPGPGLAGTRRSRWSPPRTCTRSRRTAPTACAGFSPIPAMSMVSHCVGTRFIQLIGGVMTSFYDWYADLPGGQPAGLRRPDRRAGVRRLVGRDLPDDVGLQRPGDPHARRALDGRGPLPRHQGRHGQPGLRRQHEVRRRVAARAGRHRRRARDGDGPRDAARSSSSTARSPFFRDYVRTYTDLPFLVRLEPHGDDGALVPASS